MNMSKTMINTLAFGKTQFLIDVITMVITASRTRIYFVLVVVVGFSVLLASLTKIHPRSSFRLWQLIVENVSEHISENVSKLFIENGENVSNMRNTSENVSDFITSSKISLDPALRPGHVISVQSPACGPDPEKYLPQDPCCYGTGCCKDGVAIVLPKGIVNWTSDTDLVIVVPEAHRWKYMRHDSSLSWLTEQKEFPFVTCPSCSLEIDPICSVKTNQGFEAAAWLAFIFYNYHRLPRTVAFLHGHPWLQGTQGTGHKKKFECTNLGRLVELKPFLNEDIFIYIGHQHFEAHNTTPFMKYYYETAFGLPHPGNENFTFQVGPHFVVGRNRILAHPREAYGRLFKFASGMLNDTGDDKFGFASQQGHLGAGVWFLEVQWNLIFNEKEVMKHPETADSLRCKLGWCLGSAHC